MHNINLSLKKYKSKKYLREVEKILCALINKPRAFLYTYPEYELNKTQQEYFTSQVQRLVSGEPIQYILQQVEFYNLNFFVDSRVLIPRIETEQLVSEALQFNFAKKNIKVLDLGTGSGAIALAIAYNQPSWQVVATDISTDALAVANINNNNLNIKNVKFIHSDWFENIDNKFDMIIANPPYIAKNCAHLENNVKSYEPHSALIADDSGYKDLQHIIEQVHNYLHANGVLLLEHGFLQQQKLLDFAKQCDYLKVQGLQDEFGKDRIVKIVTN